MIRTLLRRLRVRIAAPLVAPLTRDLASAYADITHLRAMREHAEAETAALAALHSGAVNERDALRAELADKRPRAPVPEARRRVLLAVVQTCDTPPTASYVADYAVGCESFAGLSLSSVARIVSDVAAEGWLAADGHKPLRYTLTAKGRDDLRSAA